MKHFKAIGLMSGTSLDGLDIVGCEFLEVDNKWSYKLLSGITVPYPLVLHNSLSIAHRLPAHLLAKLDQDLGVFFGEEINKQLQQYSFEPDIIASHGHTVFHQPEKGITLQIGDPQQIAQITGITTVADFRRKDVEAGGQGAPLVPIGDRLLFPDYQFCLNLGGIANISFEKNNKRIAYDCCPFNQVLNFLALREGQDFDEGGKLSASGKVIPALLNNWNDLPFYKHAGPRSMGREWVETAFLSQLEKYKKEKSADLLKTAVDHFAWVIGKIIESETVFERAKVLVTGGGAQNEHFIETLRKSVGSGQWAVDIIVADKELLQFKEALVFAFLGVLRTENKVNILSDVTGAPTDSSGGEIFQKFSS